MSLSRILRFILGVIIAAVLMGIILPFAGIPSSHFLPPSYVYQKAQGVTRGYVTGKYYEVTANPFHVGKKNYFLNYSFRAHTPPPRGVTQPGPVQTYNATARISRSLYHQYKGQQDLNNGTGPNPKQVVPLRPYPLRIKYEPSYPDINGIDETWAATHQMGRNIGPGSNTFSGWIIYVVAAIILGYLLAMLLETFMKREDI